MSDYCPRCDTDTHCCPGCGEPLGHETNICNDCWIEHVLLEAFERMLPR